MLLHSHKQDTFAGRVITDTASQKKKITLLSPLYLQQFLNLHTNIGDPITVVVVNKRPKRTLLQNNFLWSYYNEIARETGYTADEIHEYCKTKFLPSKVVEVFKEKVRMKTSTTDLTVNEFAEYIIAIENETGIIMPPLENWDLK